MDGNLIIECFGKERESLAYNKQKLSGTTTDISCFPINLFVFVSVLREFKYTATAFLYYINLFVNRETYIPLGICVSELSKLT